VSDVWQISKLDHTGALRHTYSGELLCHDAEVTVLRCLWDGADGAPIGPDRLYGGDAFYEYYYPAQWFNVFRIHDRRGRLKDWYCNITCPPEIAEGSVRWRDLALDLLVQPDGTCWTRTNTPNWPWMPPLTPPPWPACTRSRLGWRRGAPRLRRSSPSRRGVPGTPCRARWTPGNISARIAPTYCAFRGRRPGVRLRRCARRNGRPPHVGHTQALLALAEME
jgi:hypothetical protein